MVWCQNGYTALLLACLSDHLDVARWLVTDAGSDARSERWLIADRDVDLVRLSGVCGGERTVVTLL